METRTATLGVNVGCGRGNDEADNPLIELGVAVQADAIVTRNLRDVSRGELKFPSAFPCPP